MGRSQNYPIELTETERMELKAIVKTGQQSARVRRRAQTLLWSDAGKSDLEIADLHGITPLTVATTRENWVKEKRISLVDAESEIFGLTHTEVGGYILGLWGLPEKVIEAVYYYKDPAKFDREKFHPVTAVFLADTLDGI